MRFPRSLGLYCLLPTTVVLLGAGCAKMNPKPTGPEAQEALPAADIHNRVHDFDSHLNDFQITVAGLPGSGSTPQETEKNHRELMHAAFAKLGDLLPMLEGMEPTGDFRAGLRVIAGSKSQLAGGSMDLVAEPTIDTGLRAVSRTLRIVNRDSFGGDADVTKLIDDVDARMTDLDVEHGPLHRVVVAQTMSATVAVLQKMGELLTEKAGPATKPATPGAPETPKTEAPKTTAPKTDAPKPDAAPDAPKPDAPKPDAPKPDAAPDAPKTDAPKPDATPDAPKPDAAPDAPKPDAPKPNAALDAPGADVRLV